VHQKDYTATWLMHNTNKEMRAIQDRIDRLYLELKPLQELYGIKPRSIEERYQDYLRKQQIKNSIPKPRFKLPNI
jgi:hypothetical protein